MLRPIIFHPRTLTLSVEPEQITQVVGSEFGTSSVSFVITPSGGLAPYTYAWSILSSSGTGNLTIEAPTASTTKAGWEDFVFLGDELTGTLQCVVMDSATNSAFINVSVDFIRGF